MKIFKILALLLIIAPIPTSACSSCESGQCRLASLTRTISAFGATAGEAYANARAKIPTGYTEIRSTIQKVGYKYLCYLKCGK
jgi:hypothetical protein